MTTVGTILYTSGTTGKSKGVASSQAGITNAVHIIDFYSVNPGML